MSENDELWKHLEETKRTALNTQTDVQVMKTEISTMAKSVDTLVKHLDHVDRRHTEGTKTNWPLVIMIIGAIITVGTLAFNGRVGPVEDQLIKLQDSNSKQWDIIRQNEINEAVLEERLKWTTPK